MIGTSLVWNRLRGVIVVGCFYLVCFGGIAVEAFEVSRQKSSSEKMKKLRPPNLVVLIKKPDLGGDYVLGMYEVEIDKRDQSLRRFKLWEEWPYNLKVRRESVRCNSEGPLRVKRDSKSIYVRRLNPGGLITPVNREDHLVWWAACVPEMAGVDPSTLKKKALSLGFSTFLVEKQEVLRIPKR
ncbi:hypothetical protein [Prochlorococcus sp. MIT 1341]|uniref:hypothetical protein n=1 Tax=Prochlorococcus sp. MIT 1341 TaxID=3096221 RepID=UPI002A74E28E|nr:hypothetical protein [Prochlorococcus sp. MIT 1341]